MSRQLPQIQEKPSFPQEEEKVYQFWNEIDAFKKQLEHTKDKKKFTFYDGPPFATGMPHYGNLLAGTIKDVVCRYASQTGHHVERRFGWDCHGLPVEYAIDQKLGIKSRQQVLDMGIKAYNAECRKIVMKYATDWRQIVGRFGRWIDFDNDYKTLDLSFMESEWWVFKQIFDKGLVYRGCKVMPYSTGCQTVLSNFETQQNYKSVMDPSIYITFVLKEDPSTKLVVWTTTPWTLPSNLIVCVNPNLVYVKVLDVKSNSHYILAECRLSAIYKKANQYKIIEKFTGQELNDKKVEYEPLFDFFHSQYQPRGAFRVYAADFVTADTGSGLVHCAPGFGEEDYKICNKLQIIKPDVLPIPVDNDGRLKAECKQFAGQYVKDADKQIRKELKEKGRLLVDGQEEHNYPFCWRSETPLIYKAEFVWFIKCTAIKQQLLDNNKKSQWVPKFAQEGRFNNWLQDVNDWCFSRSRFWGTPIPIWASEDSQEIVCVGSIKELQELSGCGEITDMHRENIDHITIPSKQGKGVLRRIPEVFDCWFESGSMPYCSVNYPFSVSEEDFSERFPADFIGEGIDQTRGWFYTLNVISTALRNDTPYKNLVVNGIVQAADGKKMSKSKKNYPDPMELVNEYGADAIRLYMINSPLVRAEALNFKKEGVFGVVKDIFIPWNSAFRFLFQNISRLEQSTNSEFYFDENLAQKDLTNLMDLWINANVQYLIKHLRQEMKIYHLYSVIPKLVEFLGQLTNWYIKLNRNRIKGNDGDKEMKIALNVLLNVLLKVNILLSPFVPFITEMFYQSFKLVIRNDSKYQSESVHFQDIPEYDEQSIDEKFLKDIENMEKIINLGRAIRTKKQVSLKQPIQSITLISKDDNLINGLTPLLSYIKDELNTPEVIFDRKTEDYLLYVAVPNHKALGQKHKKAYKGDVIKTLNNLQQEQVIQLKNTGKLNVCNLDFEIADFQIKEQYELKEQQDYLEFQVEEEFSVIIDFRQSDALKVKGAAREVINRIQKMRKNLKLQIEDKIVIFYDFGQNSNLIKQAFESEYQYIAQQIKKPLYQYNKKQPHLIKFSKNGEQIFDVDGETLTIAICREEVRFDVEKLDAKYKEVSKLIQQIIASQPFEDLSKNVQQTQQYQLRIEDKEYTLKNNEDFYLNWQNA